MGESKRRKATESRYGEIPKEIPKRGLIISNPIKIDLRKNAVESSGGVDPMELRFAVLYWDKLMRPQSNFLQFGNAPDEDFLESAGILRKETFIHPGGQMAQIAWDTYLNAFFHLNHAEPGVWSLSQGEKSLLLQDPSHRFAEECGLSIELLRSIPIPKSDVPLEDILNFKERRKDELNYLRIHIDHLVKEIQSSPEKTQASEKIMREIDTACADLLKVSSEWQSPFHIGNLKASVNLNGMKFLEASEKGWTLAEPYGLLAATAAALASGLVSAIDVKADIGLRSFRKSRGPFQYTYLAHRELI